MVEIGDKFVVEVRDIAIIPDKNGDEKRMYYIKGFNSLAFDDYGIEQLERPEKLSSIDQLKRPEKLSSEEFYVKGFHDAWEALGDIVLAKALSMKKEE